MTKRIIIAALLQIFAGAAFSQDADSVRQTIDAMPSFGIYKDNYFTLGTALGSKPDDKNSDVKFRISFRQRLTNSVLPFNTYLYLFYTQNTFWNVFESSLPMHDVNYNPGIGWAKMLIKDGHFNTCAEFGIRFNKDANQFLFVQYYNGYGESLLDYNQYRSRIRIGLLIRPRYFSEF